MVGSIWNHKIIYIYLPLLDSVAVSTAYLAVSNVVGRKSHCYTHLVASPLSFALLEKRDCHITAPTPHSFLHSTSVPSGPPQGLAVAHHTSTSITLTWRDPAPDRINDRDGITRFAVKRNGQRVATVTGRSYTFTGLSVATSYNFEVLAINEQGVAPDNHAARLPASTASGGTYVHTYCTNGSVYPCICLCSYLCNLLQCPTPQP